MAKKVARPRLRTRTLGAAQGFLNSGLRTIQNSYFLISSAAYFILGTTYISAIAAKLKEIGLDTLATWMTNHVDQSAAMMYAAAACMSSLPNATAMAGAIISSASIYLLKPSTDKFEYLLLVFGVVWAMRTRSQRIRFFIAALFVFLFVYKLWGQQLFKKA